MNKMTFEQFLEAYGLEEDFKDSGMTPEEYLKSTFEEESDDAPEHCQMDCYDCQNFYAGLCDECDGTNMFYEGN